MHFTKHEIFVTNRLAAKYFITEREKRLEIDQYLEKRISKDVINKFHIGYAPKGGLIDYFNVDKPFNIIGCASLLGLIIEDIETTEFFTNRIMIPIIENKNIIGFVGRVFEQDSKIKYLNSKATIIYNKASVLYPLSATYKAIHNNGYAILVEGYFDALTLISNGIYNVVAIGGTSFTQNHAKLLRRWTNKVIVCLDGDAVGQSKAETCKNTLEKFDIYGGKITLVDNMDPDEYVIIHGKKEFLNLMERV